MKLLKLSLLLFIPALLTAPLHAQTTTLTLEKALDIGVQNSRDVQINKLNIRKAQSAVKQAIGTALPSVDVAASYTYSYEVAKMPLPAIFLDPKAPPDAFITMPVGAKNAYETSITGSQVLFNSAVLTGIGASKIYLNVSKEQTKASVSNTVLSVKRAFYGALLAKEIVDVLKQSLKTGEANIEIVRALNEEGLAAEYDLMQAEVQVGNLRPQIVQAEIGYKNAIEALKLVLNLDKNSSIDVEGALPSAAPSLGSDAEYIAEAEKNNYDLRSLALKKEVDRAMINFEKSAYYPTLAAFIRHSYQGQSNDFNFLNYSMGVAGINFSMNLFNGLQTSRKVEQATVTQLQTEEQYGQLRDYTTMQIRGKLFEIERINSELESHDRNIALATRALEIANIRYGEGIGGQIEIQNSDNALRIAKMNRLQTIYQYVTAQIELDQLIGRVDPKYFRLAGLNE